MRVLITGGAGFIGSTTALHLVRRGHQVTLLDSFLEQVHGDGPDRPYEWNRIVGEVEVVRADIRDAAAVKSAVARSDAVLHLAAETGTGQSMYEVARYVDVNVRGTAILLEAVQARATPLRALVVASSRSVYGEGAYRCREHGIVYPGTRKAEDLVRRRFDPRCPECGSDVLPAATSEAAPLLPASVYASTKLAQENLCLSVGAALGMQVIVFRYQNVYGAGQSLLNPYTGILAIFSRELLAGRPIEVFEDGLQSRDFIHVDDVARANVMALERVGGGQHVVNVGSGLAVRVIDVARMLADAYGVRCELAVSGRYRAGDIRGNVSDNVRAESLLGWTPAIDFQCGIRAFAGWVSSSLPAASGDAYRRSLAELEDRGLMHG